MTLSIGQGLHSYGYQIVTIWFENLPKNKGLCDFLGGRGSYSGDLMSEIFILHLYQRTAILLQFQITGDGWREFGVKNFIHQAIDGGVNH